MNLITLLSIAVLFTFSPIVAAAEFKPAHIVGETVVLSGITPTKLLGRRIIRSSVKVTNAYKGGKIVYEPEKDYVLDIEAGTIQSVIGSRIPDFAKNVLFEKKDFDHSQFPGYGNGPFLVYVTYDCDAAPVLTVPTDQTGRLARTLAKLKTGKPIKIIAFGDSITAGGEATSKDLQFPERFAEYLRRKYPGADIKIENGATGGDTTAMGLPRLQEKVLMRKPDLVLIGFGMNDHNIEAVGGVPIPQFRKNLVAMVTQIRDATAAECILFSAFPPNPLWKFGSHRMDQYADATKGASDDVGCAYADVLAVWKIALERKDFPSMLGNNINHPTDFGHWLYEQALESIGL